MHPFDLENQVVAIEVHIEVHAAVPAPANNLTTRFRQPSSSTLTRNIELAERLDPVAHVEQHIGEERSPSQSLVGQCCGMEG